jgi:hypothetical protein
MKKSTIITMILAVGFIGLLLYSTLSAQQVECEACVTFKGQTNCASASGVDEAEALKTAVNTACGTISAGMAESIQCAGMPPERPLCKTR